MPALPPEASPGTPAWFGTSSVVSRALRLIGDGALDRESVDRFADRLGVTSRHLRRLFVQHLGATPIDVALTRRVQSAKKLLDETQLPFAQVAIAAGFGSLRRFNGEMRRTYARTPTQLRRCLPRRSSRSGRARRAKRPIAESDCYRFRLCYRPPYDWEALIAFLSARATPGVESGGSIGYQPHHRHQRQDRIDRDRAGGGRAGAVPRGAVCGSEPVAVDRRARETDVRRRRRSCGDRGAAVGRSVVEARLFGARRAFACQARGIRSSSRFAPSSGSRSPSVPPPPSPGAWPRDGDRRWRRRWARPALSDAGATAGCADRGSRRHCLESRAPFAPWRGAVCDGTLTFDGVLAAVDALRAIPGIGDVDGAIHRDARVERARCVPFGRPGAAPDGRQLFRARARREIRALAAMAQLRGHAALATVCKPRTRCDYYRLAGFLLILVLAFAS